MLGSDPLAFQIARIRFHSCSFGDGESSPHLVATPVGATMIAASHPYTVLVKISGQWPKNVTQRPGFSKLLLGGTPGHLPAVVRFLAPGSNKARPALHTLKRGPLTPPERSDDGGFHQHSIAHAVKIGKPSEPFS